MDVRASVIHSEMRHYDPRCTRPTGLRKRPSDTHVRGEWHPAAFDARSRCSDVGEQASDLRDAMVQARDIHEANKSLKSLYIQQNQISDEGAIALAQALKANHVVCS